MKNKFNSRTKMLIIIGVAVILGILAISVMYTVGKNSGNKLNQQLELGKRYLSELDYENAIAAYEAAIRIDPKNEEAYLGLAEVYVAMSDMEKALEVLAEGYEQTQTERIAERQEELTEEVAKRNAEPVQEQGDLSEDNLDGKEQASEEEQADDETENETDADNSQLASSVKFIPWSEAGLEDHVMDWQDENLEAAMREETGITDRDIMLSDVWELTMLSLNFKYHISDISALSNLRNLWWLSLDTNQISDISALSNLVNLKFLNLGYNQIDDISALSGLTNLTGLILYGNQISDISALSGLTNLESLLLSENQISDISALSGLTNLMRLDLDHNQISDISALSGLTNLTWLELLVNPIEDYSPVEFIEQNGGTLEK